MSAAGERARARIRRIRLEIELLAWFGAFGPVSVEREEMIEEFAAQVGCSVADLLAFRVGDDERDVDDIEVCNPWAGSSSVEDRTTPLRRGPSWRRIAETRA